MKKYSFVFLFLFCMFSCTHISGKYDSGTGDKITYSDNSQTIEWFPKLEFEKMSNKKGFYFIKGLKGYQQTTEYTCGPAALLALAKFYGLPGIGEDKKNEMRIAAEAGTRRDDIPKDKGKPGTTPEEMGRWLKQHGFEVSIEFEDKNDGSALEKLKENIRKGIPSIVEWADLTGHWVIAVGYDDRGNDNPYDDVLFFADSYDKYDDNQDGYSFVNANRFYWLWFDVFYFEKITWRTMITVLPKSF